MKKSLYVFSLLALMLSSGSVYAGGYDTPILYSARHMGMGGTAVGYVYDPSAIFHNPAGLGHTKFLSVTADFSPLTGALISSPDKSEGGTEVKSNPVLAPFFLAGASIRATDWLTFGVAAFPVASTAASYTYKNVAGQEVDDMTKLVFIEIAPGFAIDLPWNLKLGATYRATLAQFGREKGEAFNLDLEGWNFTGWKVGLQWQPIPWLQAGVTYRHKAVATVEADEATLMGVGVHNVSMDFVLPSKVAAGVRADVGPVGVAVDVEYSLNSQNQQSAIKAAMSPEGEPVDMLVSYFKWEDSLTLRGGVEYSILPKLLKARLGYIFDGKVSSGVYPTAFGTPPAPTHSFTGGLGTDFTLGGVGMEVNVAYAYRMGVVEVVQEDLDKQDPKCLSCSFPGEYDMRLHGIYLDTSVYF